MGKESKIGQRIFLQYSILILILGALNFYRYYTAGGMWSLIVGIICSLVFIAWILFYLFYVRGKERE